MFTEMSKQNYAQPKITITKRNGSFSEVLPPCKCTYIHITDSDTVSPFCNLHFVFANSTSYD